MRYIVSDVHKRLSYEVSEEVSDIPEGGEGLLPYYHDMSPETVDRKLVESPLILLYDDGTHDFLYWLNKQQPSITYAMRPYEDESFETYVHILEEKSHTLTGEPILYKAFIYCHDEGDREAMLGFLSYLVRKYPLEMWVYIKEYHTMRIEEDTRRLQESINQGLKDLQGL